MLDVLLDANGVWTTSKGHGPGQLRSLPIPGGMAPRRVWRAPRDEELGPFLADRLAAEVSARTSALARLTAAVNLATDDLALQLGDRVRVEMSMYDPSRGRITYRFRDTRRDSEEQPT